MTLTKLKPSHVPRNHPKRQGRHHRQSQHYAKAYWPYLPVFAVLGLGILLNSVVSRSHHNVLGYATSISNQVLLAETNGERLSHHAEALNLNAQLTAAAQAKANDMAQRNYWSHVTPDGKQPWAFVDASGYHYQAAGENLAYGFGTSDQVMTAWMHSTEHRANVLNPNYQDVGFATANVADYQGTGPATVIVALYGEPVGAIPVSAAAPSVLGTRTANVSRFSLLSTATWVPLLIAAVVGAAITLFFVRHALAWRKVLVHGEQFAMAHPFLDVFLMSAAVLALVLAHSAGSIL
jgi:uncharacterized protein YkwD